MAEIADIMTVPWTTIAYVGPTVAASVGTIADDGSGSLVPPASGPAYVLPTTTVGVDLGWGNDGIVDGNYVYLGQDTPAGSTGAFRVIDVSNPLSPVTLSTIPIPGFTNMFKAPRLKIGNIVWCVNGSSGGYGTYTDLFGVDVSNPSAPYLRGSVRVASSSSSCPYSNFIEHNGYLVMADGGENEQIYVVNVSNPAAPFVASNFALPHLVDAGLANWYKVGNYLYFMLRQAKTFRIYDLSNLPTITARGSVTTSTEAYCNINIPGTGYALVGQLGASVYQVINVSNPDAPTIVANPSGIYAQAGFAIGTKLYTVRDSRTVQAWDVSNPLSPVLESSATLPIPAGATSLYIRITWGGHLQFEGGINSCPYSSWVGNGDWFVMARTWDDSAAYNGVRRIDFKVTR